MLRCDRRVSILNIIELFPRRSADYGSPVVVFLDRGHPQFRNFYSAVLVDVVRVKSDVNCLFDPASVPFRITINNQWYTRRVQEEIHLKSIKVQWNRNS